MSTESARDSRSASLGAQTKIRTRRAALAIALLAILMVGGCMGSPAPGRTPTEPPPTTTPYPTELAEFRKACAAGLPVDWREAQVDYPETLTAQVGVASIYEAAVDARDARPPADKVIQIDEGTPTSKEIAVRCRLAAKLTASSEALTLEPDDGEWQYRDFSATGVVQWAWNVTPAKPVNQKLTLVLRPAIDMSSPEGRPESTYGLDGNTEVRVFTDVVVRGTPLEVIAFWFETQWPLAVGIVTALAVAKPVWNWLKNRIKNSTKDGSSAGA